MLEWLGGSYDPEAFLAATVKFDDPRARWRTAEDAGSTPPVVPV